MDRAHGRSTEFWYLSFCWLRSCWPPCWYWALVLIQSRIFLLLTVVTLTFLCFVIRDAFKVPVMKLGNKMNEDKIAKEISSIWTHRVWNLLLKQPVIFRSRLEGYKENFDPQETIIFAICRAIRSTCLMSRQWSNSRHFDMMIQKQKVGKWVSCGLKARLLSKSLKTFVVKTQNPRHHHDFKFN